MRGDRIRMMATERIAMLMLAVLLLAWALIALVKKDNGFEVKEPQTIVRVDTIYVATKSKQTDDSETQTGTTHRPKVAIGEHTRDHLNEPVAEE